MAYTSGSNPTNGFQIGPDPIMSGLMSHLATLPMAIHLAPYLMTALMSIALPLNEQQFLRHVEKEAEHGIKPMDQIASMRISHAHLLDHAKRARAQTVVTSSPIVRVEEHVAAEILEMLALGYEFAIAELEADMRKDVGAVVKLQKQRKLLLSHIEAQTARLVRKEEHAGQLKILQTAVTGLHPGAGTSPALVDLGKIVEYLETLEDVSQELDQNALNVESLMTRSHK